MKKLIYLSLVAIVVLSGCKGNSFMTQRYTKFAHASHKTNHTEKAIVKTQAPVSAENNPETELVKNVETEPVSASSNSSIKENILERIAVQIYPTGLKLTKSETLNTEDLKQVNKSKKTSQEKKEAAQKVIGTVLKIVLWIVILAVVVGVILIIAALA
jgi:cobalamin biosynthesis Mg chelatase CobN